MAAAGQLVQFATGQPNLTQWAQRLAAEDRAVGERLGDGGIVAHGQPEPLPLINETRDGKHGIRRDGHRLTVQRNGRAVGQPAEQPGNQPAPQDPAPVRAQGEFGSQVRLRGQETRSRHPPLGHGRQRRLQQVAPLPGDDHPVQRQRSLLAREPVPDPAPPGVGGGKLLAGIPRPAPGDHRRGGMLAARSGRRTVALPLAVIEEQGDRQADHPAAGSDVEQRFVVVGAIELHGGRAVQLDAARPVCRGAGPADGFEQFLHRSRHRTGLPDTEGGQLRAPGPLPRWGAAGYHRLGRGDALDQVKKRLAPRCPSTRRSCAGLP